MNDLARQAAAERQRIRRQRQQNGIGVAPVEYNHDAVDWLVEHRWLAAWDDGDRRAVGEAIGAVIHDLVTRDAVDEGDELYFNDCLMEDES